MNIIAGLIVASMLIFGTAEACDPKPSEPRWVKTVQGDTAIHKAIRRNDTAKARKIVSTGSKRTLCATNSLGQTPWALARILDRTDISLMLISANATWQCNE